MSILQSIILGIIQGITEFLPISSSGHLVIVPYLLRWDIPDADAFIFNILVQVASLLAVLIYFRNDLIVITRAWFVSLANRRPFADPNARQGWLLILATIPGGLIGLGLKSTIERAFASPTTAAFFLLITAGLLLIAEQVGKRTKKRADLNWIDAVWIGISQGLAVFPGISRSGATITGGMARQLDRPAAARFSFLMSVPVMLAAGLLASIDLINMPASASLLGTYIPGFLASAVVGYLSIRWLIGYLTHRPLYVFAIYCGALGLFVLALNLFGY